MRWIRSEFLKQYSKIKFDTVSLCDNVKMAKAKDERAVVEKSVAAFLMGGDICAYETEETMQQSRLSEPYGWAVLSGASAAGQ